MVKREKETMGEAAMRLVLTRFCLVLTCLSAVLLASCSNRSSTAEMPDSAAARASLQRGSLSVWAVHDPLYGAATQGSRIIARAEHTSGELAKIVLEVISGALSDCTEIDREDSSPGVLPCRRDAQWQSTTCHFRAGTKRGQCTFNVGAGDSGIIVTYRAIATPRVGATVSSPSISFSGGEPSPGTLRPIWWHTSQEDAPADRINIGYFPDSIGTDGEGYSSYATFAEDVASTVGQAFFNDEAQYAHSFTSNRHFFNLWAGPFGANIEMADPCHETFDLDASSARDATDAAAILHRWKWGGHADCADPKPQGNGCVLANQSTTGYRMVHEAGHFVFGLGDEYKYNPPRMRMSCSTPPNVFKTCDPAHPECVKIESSELYRFDDNSYETMDSDRKSKSDFRNNSSEAVSNRFAKCQADVCYKIGEPLICVEGT